MIKFTGIALMAAVALAVSPAFAGDKACCAKTASNTKDACAATFANLDLTAAQKSKMETLVDEYTKGGCTKESMAKMEKGAKSILSKEQFAAWQTACRGMSEKTQS